MKVQLVTPYRVSLLQRYGVMVRGNVSSVYPPLVVPLRRDGAYEGWERCGRDLASAEILKKIVYRVLGFPVSK